MKQKPSMKGVFSDEENVVGLSAFLWRNDDLLGP